MNQNRPLNLRRLVIIAAVLLAIIVALLFWARELVREVVVVPLSYIFWVLGILIDATPQIFFWVALLIISFLIAARGVSQKRKALPATPRPIREEDHTHAVSGRVAYWMGKVRLLNAYQGSYFRSSFHSSVGRLLVEQLAYRYHMPAQEIENRLRDNTIDVPPDVREYALYNLDRPEAGYRNIFDFAWRSLLNWVQSLFLRVRSTPQPDPVDEQLTRILHYMEKELEVSNDDTGQ